jgi:hypothetical protein
MCIVWADKCLDVREVTDMLTALDDVVNTRGVPMPGRLFTAMDFLPSSRKEAETKAEVPSK